MLVAEDRSIDLGLGRIFQALDLLLGLRGHISLERLDVFLDASLHPFQQADPLPVLPVSVLFRHVNLLSISRRGGCPHPPSRAKLDSFYVGRNDPGSLNWLGCPLGHWYSFETSTRI